MKNLDLFNRGCGILNFLPLGRAKTRLLSQKTKKSVFTACFLFAISVASNAQGTIAFGNSALTLFTVFGRSATLTDGSWNFGVFVNGSLDPVLPLGVSSTTSPGIIVAPSVYAIPGTEPGQTVFLQIRGWAASYGTDWQAARANGLLGETDVRPVTLGPTAGPGTVIWQTASGTNPSRFYGAYFSVPEPATLSIVSFGLLWLCYSRLFRNRR